MFIFILFILLALAGIGLITAGALSKKAGLGAGGFATAVVAAIVLLVGMYNSVGPSDTGIVTAFGHVQGGDLGPGIHFLAPWDNVTIWDNSEQVTTSSDKGCITVRIANQQTACANVTIYWQDDRSNADSQFRTFRTFARVQNALITRELDNELNIAFESFDPVTEASSTAIPGSPGFPTVSQLAHKALVLMQAADAGQINVKGINIPRLTYDTQVQEGLNKVLLAKAATNVALQNIQTALAQAKANKDLQVNLTPLVVQQNCLNDTVTISQAHGTFPIGWGCFLSSSLGVITGNSTTPVK